jgi:hypothetical protein
MPICLIWETLKNKAYFKFSVYALATGSTILIICMQAKEVVADECVFVNISNYFSWQLKNPFENCAIQAVYPSTKHW